MYKLIFFILGILFTFFMLEIRDKCFIRNSTKQLQIQNIKTLLRQVARWAVAAEGDTDPMIAVLHANYAAGYLWALNDIATTEEIEAVSGINYLEFRDKITEVQDNATLKVVQACPDYAPPPSILTQIIK